MYVNLLSYCPCSLRVLLIDRIHHLCFTTFFSLQVYISLMLLHLKYKIKIIANVVYPFSEFKNKTLEVNNVKSTTDKHSSVA